MATTTTTTTTAKQILRLLRRMTTKKAKPKATTKAKCGGSSPFDFARGQNDNGFWIVRERTTATATARCGLANGGGREADFSTALLTMMP